jgi:hypothetical protein
MLFVLSLLWELKSMHCGDGDLDGLKYRCAGNMTIIYLYYSTWKIILWAEIETSV